MVNTRSARKCTPTGKCTNRKIFINVHTTREKREILLCHSKEWREPNIEKTSNDARMIILKLNSSRELYYRLHMARRISVNLQEQDKIIRHRATTTIRRPKIKQYCVSNEGGFPNQREHHIILLKYVAVHPTDKYSLSGIYLNHSFE